MKLPSGFTCVRPIDCEEAPTVTVQSVDWRAGYLQAQREYWAADEADRKRAIEARRKLMTGMLLAVLIAGAWCIGRFY